MNKYHAKPHRDPLGSANSKQQNYQDAARLDRLANKAGKEIVEDTTRTELRQHANRLRTAAGKRGR